jgi:hypothetical protein
VADNAEDRCIADFLSGRDSPWWKTGVAGFQLSYFRAVRARLRLGEAVLVFPEAGRQIGENSLLRSNARLTRGLGHSAIVTQTPIVPFLITGLEALRHERGEGVLRMMRDLLARRNPHPVRIIFDAPLSPPAAASAARARRNQEQELVAAVAHAIRTLARTHAPYMLEPLR